MRKDKEQAFQLREEGKSYKEIENNLGVPRSTLSNWFSKEDWSINIKNRLAKSAQETSKVRIIELNKVRGKKLEQSYENARREARKEFEALKYHPLFITGLMLYWGEGEKLSKHRVRLTNTDPEMISLYRVFLEQVCNIPKDKIRASILIYPDNSEEDCLEFWSRESGLPRANFIKGVTITGRHETKRLPWGICMIHVSNSYFKVKITEWLRLLPKALMDKGYYENI